MEWKNQNGTNVLGLKNVHQVAGQFCFDVCSLDVAGRLQQIQPGRDTTVSNVLQIKSLRGPSGMTPFISIAAAAVVGTVFKNVNPAYGSMLAQVLQGVIDAVFKREFAAEDRKSTRLNSSHVRISYAVFCLKKKI